MVDKRKASRASNGSGADGDRSAKRRKSVAPLAQSQTFDLMEGESPESTTVYGLAFLESIRRTADKSGRLVAGYFEELLPRKGNEDYYAQTPMPISLRTIQHKLERREFANLAELEAWLRRMVKNAKDYYPRNSQNFEDAERVRKAVSNYMTKHNPAYRQIVNYSNLAVPVPDNYVPIDWEHGEPALSAQASSAGGDEDADEADAQGDEDEAAVGNEHEEDDQEDDEDEDEDENDNDDEDENDNDDEDETSDVGSRRRKIVIKSHTPSRPTKTGAKAKSDEEYKGVPYKGLNFQQAQEKIVEELIRAEDAEGYARFEPFYNLPPRSLKEYFSVIQHPLSLKALQKLVRGIHGRKPATGVSEFKSWAAFEEKAELLWDNAQFFNEECSPIYELATELYMAFAIELEKAKAVVKEPPQPQKIKLRVPSQPQATPPVNTAPKKITLVHSSQNTTASPAPQPPVAEGQVNSVPVQRPAMSAPNGAAPNGQSMTPGYPAQRASISAPMPSATPVPARTQPEIAVSKTPVFLPRPNGIPSQPLVNVNGMPPPIQMQPYQHPATPMQNGYQQPPPPPPPEPRYNPVYQGEYRAPGRGRADAIIQSVHIRGHPNMQVESGSRVNIRFPADSKLAMHTSTMHVPNNQFQLQVIPVLAPLEHQQRAYKLFVSVNGQNQSRQAPIPIPGDDLRLGINSLVFDAKLMLGLNTIVIHVIASLPKGQTLSRGETCEVEEFKIVAQLLR